MHKGFIVCGILHTSLNLARRAKIMKMLNMEPNDTKSLTKMTREEAEEFLQEGVSIICRVSRREFMEVTNLMDLKNLERLKEIGVYDTFELYLE